jgi:hypothetical protein
MGYPNRVTSSVIFVSRLDVSIGFYSDVFFATRPFTIPRLPCWLPRTVSRST